MEFVNRGESSSGHQHEMINDMNQPHQSYHHHAPDPMPSHSPKPKRKHIDWAARTVRIEIFIILLGCAILLIIVSLFLAVNSSTENSEFQNVAKNKWQAVFLNGSQTGGNGELTTYFGHIADINSQQLILNDVYYLTASTSKNSQANQLAKLGCDQLHAPYDPMYINRSQLAYWENIQDTGKVVQAINTYIKQNPNGPKCTTSSTKTPTTTTPSNTTTTPSTTTPGTTTP